MRCPKCGCQDDKVIDSRSSREGATIRRRRECIGCGYRYTTYEIIERPRLLVVKRDRRTEEFSRDKLVASIEKACQKRPVTQETIAALVERIVDDLSNEFDREVPYASIYRRFDEATDFVQEVKKLEKPHDTLTARLPGI